MNNMNLYLGEEKKNQQVYKMTTVGEAVEYADCTSAQK